MTPLVTTEKKVIAAVLAFHAASYPTLKLELPDFHTVDPEVDVEFVQTEIEFEAQHLDICAQRHLRITGMLYLTHRRRSGGGQRAFITYSDALFTYLGLKVIDGITYFEVKPFNGSGIPGFDGRMNAVKFQTDYFS